MDMRFNEVFYDFTDDVPFVVFDDNQGRSFFIKITPHTAADILNYLNNSKKQFGQGFYNIFVDIFNCSDMKITGLKITEYSEEGYKGYLEVDKDDRKFCYYLTGDDIILFSIMFDKPVKVSKNIFFDFKPEQVKSPLSEIFLDAKFEN
ncbi:MAG TPA: hypothetical protein PLO89_05805 [Spirochaetota bacterium]|nr:hypothetical protein [Spirochaetota bacterium]